MVNKQSVNNCKLIWDWLCRARWWIGQEQPCTREECDVGTRCKVHGMENNSKICSQFMH